MKSLFKYIKNAGVSLPVNPTEIKIKEPKPRDKTNSVIPDYLLKSVLENTIESSLKDFAHKVVLVLLIEYGLKRSEVASLRLQNLVMQDAGCFLQLKNRSVPLLKDTVLMLDRYLDKLLVYHGSIGEEDLLIQVHENKICLKPLSGSTIYRICERYTSHFPSELKPVSPEKLRFTRVVQAVASNATNRDLRIVFGYNRKQIVGDIKRAGIHGQ